MQNLTTVEAATVLTGIQIVADTAAKAQLEPVIYYGGYLLNAYVLREVLVNNGMGRTNAFWNAGTTISHVLIGHYLFGESLSTTQEIGVALIVTGIFLLTE